MNLRSTLAAPLLVAAGLIGAPSAQALDLTVELTGARSDQGLVAAALYGSADSWLKQPLTGQRSAAAAKVVLVFRNLAPGRYALTALHDENGNGKMDSNVVGMPTERFGFSRDAQGVMGPARFEDAVLDLAADTTISITLR